MIRGRWTLVLVGIAAMSMIPATGAVADAGVDSVMPLLSTADAAKGKKLAVRCRACHDFKKGGKNKLGPPLWNVVGKAKATQEGFKYSKALAAVGGEWTYEALSAWLENPKKFVPGTKMLFPGLKKKEDRADLIAYLRSLSDEPLALPVADATPVSDKPKVITR